VIKVPIQHVRMSSTPRPLTISRVGVSRPSIVRSIGERFAPRHSRQSLRKARAGTVRLTIKVRPRSYTAAMPTVRDPLYQRHRFPPEVISHAVWLYFRFPLSLRMVEEMLATRGFFVTYETVGQWGRRSARHSPIRSASARLLAATNGIWMRSSSRSPASHTGSSAPSIRTASFSTSWSNIEETLARRSGS
jgi:hypothetical protein